MAFNIYKYYNNDIYNNDIVNMIDNNKYVDNIETKIENMENDYNEQINQINNINNINSYISNISNDKSLFLLQEELKHIKLLSKYSLINNNIDINFMKKTLNIILSISEILRKRLNQKELFNKNNNINRGSYNFCNYKENCSHLYERKKHKCYHDHYVHNMVSLDIKNLINYLNKLKNISKNNSKEILKTINTLSYVINHMESELNAKCKYYEESEWYKFHK